MKPIERVAPKIGEIVGHGRVNKMRGLPAKMEPGQINSKKVVALPWSWHINLCKIIEYLDRYLGIPELASTQLKNIPRTPFAICSGNINSQMI
ncbi:MAG: hypothetical protein EOO20_11355 [Chryseobacterium sp.]|nr:MAG: hypothetical protein EOO20_11355 [Chryseobacterium sp.]